MKRVVGVLAVSSLLGCSAHAPIAHPAPIASTSSQPSVKTTSPPVFCSTSDTAKASADLIARVEIRGLIRLRATDLCPNLGTKAGSEVNEERVHEDASSFWKTGLIDSVDVASELSASGRSVTFLIHERPTIRKTTVEGVQAAELAEVIARFPAAGDLFDAATIKEDIARVRDDYKDEAYRRADVQFQIDPAPDNQVDLHIVVVEGPQTLVQAIVLHGESKDRESALMELIDTENGTYNTPGKPYRPDVLERDRLIMNQYYFDRGMVNVNIDEEELALSEDGTAVTLTIEISEGLVFKLGKLRCVGDLAAGERKCLDLLGIKQGEVFNRSKMIEGMNRIVAFQAESHHGVSVEPETTLDTKKRTIDIGVKVSKGP
jgi:outer membrane protein insertion porin family